MYRAAFGATVVLLLGFFAGCGSDYTRVGGVTVEKGDISTCEGGGQYQAMTCYQLAEKFPARPEGKRYALTACQVGDNPMNFCVAAWQHIDEYDRPTQTYLADRAAAAVATARQQMGSNDPDFFYFDQAFRVGPPTGGCIDDKCSDPPYGHYESIALAAAALSGKSDKAFLRDAALVAYCEHQGVELACQLAQALGGQIPDPAATQAKIATYKQKLAEWNSFDARRIGLDVAETAGEAAQEQRGHEMMMQGLATGLANGAASAAAFTPPPINMPPPQLPHVAAAGPRPEPRDGYIPTPAVIHPAAAPTVGPINPASPAHGPGLGCPTQGACTLGNRASSQSNAVVPSGTVAGGTVAGGRMPGTSTGTAGGTVLAANPSSGGLPPPNPANWREGLPGCVAVTKQPNGGMFNLTLVNNCGQAVHVFTSDAGSGPLSPGQTGHMIASASAAFDMAVCPEGFWAVGANNFSWVPGEQYRCWNGSR